MLVDRYRDKIEELVERSGGRVRADIVHERLGVLDPEHPYTASERTTRRAVRRAKAAYRAGHRRTYRPWITEPGMWLLCGSRHKSHYAAPGIMRRRGRWPGEGG